MKEKQTPGFATGRQAEAGGQPDLAIRLYEKEIAANCKNLLPYQRLLVLYRRQKKYKQELAIGEMDTPEKYSSQKNKKGYL